MRTCAIAAILLAAAGFAQDLPPELAEPAAKYKAAAEALEKGRLAAAAQAAQPYASALDEVKKAATAKGDVKTSEAATKEREAALAGKLGPELPAGLPALRLQGTRKALLMKLEPVNADFGKRKKRLDGEYLGFLDSLAQKADPESALAKRIATEKEALLSEEKTPAEKPSEDKKEAKTSRSKNVVVNGDFEKVVDGKPETWKMPECEFVTVKRENKNTFLRFDCPVRSDDKAGCYSVRQEIDLPKGAKIVAISAKLRTRNDTGNIFPRAQVGFLNQEEKYFSCAAAWGNGKRGPWQRIHADMDIPKTAIKAFVEVINDQCPGQIDFDDIEVTFQ